MDLTKGIRVDQGTQKGSVYDVIQLVGKTSQSYAVRVLSRLYDSYPELMPKSYRLRINGKGQLTPVADARTLVEVAWLCPGRAATEFRRKGAESVCRLLGGDLSLVDEVQHRHAQVAGSAEEAFLLHKDGASNDTAVTAAAANKRGLDEDDEVYATKKRQLIQEIDQATNASMIKAHADTIRFHAQTSVDIIAILSGGPVAPAPATLQLLQTIRHNVANRLSSMLDTGMQGQLAIQSSQQQQEQQQQQQQLTIN